MKQTLVGNEKGFTLIELIVVIVILGLLAVVAIPRFSDLREEAAVAAATGVWGAAQGAASINFAASLVGKTALERPAYHATDCTGGLIVTTTATPNIGGQCLMSALDGVPEGWTVSGASIVGPALPNGTIPTITVTTSETNTNKAVLTRTNF